MSYLNYNSTNAPRNHTLNISDIAYNQVLTTRQALNTFTNAAKAFVNAPKDAQVIINSGATECIANCVLWAKMYIKHGCVCGTDLDHFAVKANCDNLKMPYIQLQKFIPNACAMVMLTHVSGKTGEILDINTFVRNWANYAWLSERDATNEDNLQAAEGAHVRQYRPLLVVDASQSVGKIPIDMERWKLDAVFFSLHKLGGPQGFGLMILNKHAPFPFVPLIAGDQQNKLRGGTLDLGQLVGYQKLFKVVSYDTQNTWKEAVKYFKKEGLQVVEPKRKHLFNTILIKVNMCPLGVINSLATNDSIYVGSISACALEHAANVSEGYIRISFTDSKQLTPKIMSRIVETIRQHEEVAKMKGGDSTTNDYSFRHNISDNTADGDFDTIDNDPVEKLLSQIDLNDSDDDEKTDLDFI